MLLLSYEYKDSNKGGWQFSKISLKKINLFVGASGSGKTRFLNSLLNVASFIHKNDNFRSGIWDILFCINKINYRWQFEGVEKGVNETDKIVVFDRLSIQNEDKSETELYVRTDSSFLFNNQTLPKLPKNSTGIFLLKDEDQIAPVHAGFANILRRSFFGSDLQLACSITNLPNELLINSKNKLGIPANQTWDIPLNVKLYLLQKDNKRVFNSLIEQYKAIFPLIEDVSFADGTKLLSGLANGNIPVFSIKERLVDQPIMLHDISSGMQKVLLILADIVTMQPGSIYVIDEYENSLGLNAINFLPGFLADFSDKSQFIITSHHPYLINHMPIANWHMFYRTGSHVVIESGDQLALKYGMSKQDAFIQLINDPAYTGIQT
jgi:AAA15 family ATPase/GTPase